MKALIMLNDDDHKREQFEKLYHDVRILYETLQPDAFLADYVQEYKWLCKLYMLYRKKFYPRDHFQITEEDGAKTRELIREFVDVQEIEDEFPTYKLDENYLTKIREMNPDAKALDIEAMLDAEIRIRLDEDEDIQPLSERLKRIIQQKRAGTLAGIALLHEFEDLTKQVVEIIQETQRPVVNSIAKEVASRVDGDSMEPMLHSGDIVVIDRDDKRIVKNRIYAIFHEEGLTAKYVERKKELLILRPINPNSDVQIIDLKELPDPIVGRIIGAWKEL